MNREIRESLKNFDRVWQRVSGADGGAALPPAEGNEADRLRRFVLDASGAGEYYRLMARRTKGGAQKQLLAMAAEERKMLGRLQMEYFLLTGDTLTPKTPGPSREGLLSQLRRCYMNEGLVARAAAAAARNCSRETLAALYRENAGLAAAHQQSLYGLIRRAVG